MPSLAPAALKRGLPGLLSPEIGGLSAAAVGIAGLAAFLAVTEDVHDEDGHALDRRLLKALREKGDSRDPIGPDWLKTAAVEATSLGGVTVLAAATAATAGGLLLAGRRRQAAVVGGSFAVGLAISEAVKRLFRRQRPPGAYHLVEAKPHSFPSGHALLSAATFLTLGAVLASDAKSLAVKGYILGGAALTSLMVGMSRVYLGVHWASDVFAGWGLGAAWGAACAHIAHEPERGGRRRQS